MKVLLSTDIYHQPLIESIASSENFEVCVRGCNLEHIGVKMASKHKDGFEIKSDEPNEKKKRTEKDENSQRSEKSSSDETEISEEEDESENRVP